MTCTFNLYIKFTVFAITNYEDAQGNAKCRNRSGLRWLGVTQGQPLQTIALTVPSELFGFLFLFFTLFFRFWAVRWIKLAISAAVERTLIYRIVSYRNHFDRAHTTSYSNLIETMSLSLPFSRFYRLFFAKVRGHVTVTTHLLGQFVVRIGWDLLCSSHIGLI